MLNIKINVEKSITKYQNIKTRSALMNFPSVLDSNMASDSTVGWNRNM